MLEYEDRPPITSMLERLASRELSFGVVPADQLFTQADRQAQYARFEQMVGRTPLLNFHQSHITTGNNNIWVKVESENPTESHYDRASLAILKRLESEGFIKPGDTILEGTSGSAGRSFAYFCNRLGFKLNMIVPHKDEFPQERVRDIETLGANIIHADERGGVAKVIRKVQRTLVELKRDGWEREAYQLEGKPVFIFRKDNEVICAPNHSEIIITPQAFGGIGQEIVDAGVRIDTFIGTLGNGATMKGISEALRSAYGDVTVIGTENAASPTNAIRKLRAQYGEDLLRAKFLEMYGFKMPEKGELTYHDSFGASTPGYEPIFVETDNIDDIILVKNEWRDFKRRQNTIAWLNKNHVTMIGNTSAENLYIAYMLTEPGGWTDKNILVIFYDKGDQYPDWPPERKTYVYPINERPKPDEVPYAVRRLRSVQPPVGR